MQQRVDFPSGKRAKEEEAANFWLTLRSFDMYMKKDIVFGIIRFHKIYTSSLSDAPSSV